MDDLSYPPQVLQEDTKSYNNQINNTTQRGPRGLNETFVLSSSEEGPADQIDSVEKVIISTDTDSNIKKNNGGYDNLSDADAQKPTTLEKTVTSCSHSEIKSRHEPQSVLCPHVNCPEKIIICLDLHEEMDSTVFRSRAGDRYTGLELAKRAINMFVMHKTQMNPQNEFAFLVFHEESTVIHSFSSRAQDMLNTLDEIHIETQKSGPLNISHLFETVKENIELPVVNGDPQVIPPPYVVRVILVFGRSHCVPVFASSKVQRELESSPYFFTDVLYIHDPPSTENKCEEIFHILCELDHNGMSYIFEQSKYTPILNSGAKLLAHPLQRPRQLEAMYKIGPSVATVPVPTPSE